jgi:hypothetical protein
VLSTNGNAGPTSYDTVNADHYLHDLEEGFLPFLQRKGISFKETLFQQDGVWPHTANAVLDVLNKHLDDRVLSNRFPEQFRYGLALPPILCRS